MKYGVLLVITGCCGLLGIVVCALCAQSKFSSAFSLLLTAAAVPVVATTTSGALQAVLSRGNMCIRVRSQPADHSSHLKKRELLRRIVSFGKTDRMLRSNFDNRQHRKLSITPKALFIAKQSLRDSSMNRDFAAANSHSMHVALFFGGPGKREMKPNKNTCA